MTPDVDLNKRIWDEIMAMARASAVERRMRRELAAIEVQAFKRGNPRVTRLRLGGSSLL